MLCVQFRSAGPPPLPVPAPAEVHHAALARVTGQAADAVEYALPLPDAAVSANGSVLVTCAYAGGSGRRRVAFPS